MRGETHRTKFGKKNERWVKHQPTEIAVHISLRQKRVVRLHVFPANVSPSRAVDFVSLKPSPGWSPMLMHIPHDRSPAVLSTCTHNALLNTGGYGPDPFNGKGIEQYSLIWHRICGAVVTDRAAVQPGRQQTKPTHTDFNLCSHTVTRSPILPLTGKWSPPPCKDMD